MTHLRYILRISTFTFLSLGAVSLLSACGKHVEPARANEAGIDAAKSGEKEKSDEDKKHDESGDKGVRLSTNVRERLGLSVEELHTTEYRPEVIAYGALEEDPAYIFILRAPVAGMVRVDDKVTLLGIGQGVEASAVVGRITPRLGPVEYLDIESRLTQANAEVAEATASHHTAQVALERSKKLNESQLVSDRALEETELRVTQESAKLDAAKQVVAQLESARNTGGVGVASLPLQVTRGGEIVESNLRDGEAVEAGQVLLKIADYDHLIARVTLPVGTSADDGVKDARIVAVGQEDHPLAAERTASVGAGGGRLEGRTLLYAVDARDRHLRPGTGVSAYLPTTGEMLSGLIVPRSAVVRYMGRSWVYAQLEEGQFQRRTIDTKCATASGWFVDSGLSDGDQVVVARAAVLLSEEAKAAIEQEEQSAE